MNVYSIDFAGISITYRGWALAISQSLLENYDRPMVEETFYSEGQPAYSIDFNQNGLLKNTNISVSKNIGDKISVGLGFNLISGELEKILEENWNGPQIRITDMKSFDWSGFYLNGGLVINILENFTTAIIFRTPYSKKADSYSLYRFQSLPDVTDIRIENSGRSVYKQPLILGLGLGYEFSSNFKAAADISFFNWSKYEVEYFGEILRRQFKDIIKLSSGVEYLAFLKIFGQDVKIPIRMGISYDPQPTQEPHSKYLNFSLGTGIHWGKFFLDAGGFFGSENGSGENLTARRFSITIGINL
jgi:hypothetical protein